jgi:AsmA protein
MSIGRKITLGVVVGLAVIVLALVIVVPLLVDVDRYRSQVVAHLEEETGKPAQIGHLSLTVFPSVSVRIDDFKLGNPAGFPSGAFLEVRRISVVVDAGALWDRQVIIKSLQLDDPSIHLLSDSRGHWNFENQSKKPVVREASAGDKPLFTLGVIAEVIVRRAYLTVADAVSPGEAGPAYFEARGVSSRLQQVDLNAFTGSASGRPPSSADGYGAPSLWGASILYAATPSSDSRRAAQGTLSADLLRFQNLQATSVKSKLRLFAKQVFFDDLNFDFCGGHAVGDLSLNFGGPNLRYATNARLSSVDMAKLLEAFPDLKGKMTGKMDGNAKILGEVPRTAEPLAGVRGTGQVTIRNGQLPSLQLNKNLLLLARLSNIGPASGDPSSFSSLSADFNIADQKITSNKITLVGNGVDVDGSGVLGVAGAGSLDYQGVASIAAGQSVVSNLLAGLSGAKQEGGKLTFPFAVAGTLENPKFSLKSARGTSLLGKQGQSTQPGQQPADLVKGLTGLLKKKKQTGQ